MDLIGGSVMRWAVSLFFVRQGGGCTLLQDSIAVHAIVVSVSCKPIPTAVMGSA